MSAQTRPNLGGLFDGSTPADRTSGIAGRLGPRLVTAPAGVQAENATRASSAVRAAEVVEESKVTDPPGTSRGSGSAERPIDPLTWIDPIRALELYFGVLQTILDANRQFVMGLAGVLVTGGTRLRGGLDSMRTKP